MNTLSKVLLSAIAPLAVVTAYVPTAEAQVQVVEYPTNAYVASYAPIYYEGHAHYYYRNHFYYRDHGGWHGYAHEPAGLWGRRGEWGGHRHGWR